MVRKLALIAAGALLLGVGSTRADDAVLDQALREVQPAFLAEEDVDEDDVGMERLDLTQRVGACRGDTRDA